MLNEKLQQAKEEKTKVVLELNKELNIMQAKFKPLLQQYKGLVEYLEFVVQKGAERWFENKYPDGIQVCVGAQGHYSIREFSDAHFYIKEDGTVVIDFDEAHHPYDRYSVSVPIDDLEKYVQDL